MNQQIKISVRNVYGRFLNYPNCDTSKKFASLLNVKTFTTQQLSGIESLGYTVSKSVDLKIQD